MSEAFIPKTILTVIATMLVIVSSIACNKNGGGANSSNGDSDSLIIFGTDTDTIEKTEIDSNKSLDSEVNTDTNSEVKNDSDSSSNSDNILVRRSEYESIGDELYDLDDPLEGSITYSITDGNQDGYYAIDSVTGVITVASIIDDSFDTVHTDLLTIDASETIYTIEIVDGYDHFIQNLPAGFTVLSQHNTFFVDDQSEWTVMNNLWGKGDAVPDTDFRIATLYTDNMPDDTVFIWDVPSNPSSFNGSSVWCYTNVFWGDRINYRDNLEKFPFQLSSLDSLTLDFDFEQLFGNDKFKVSLNMFMTDESTLGPFSNNDGDFFIVLDQIGTWIPGYASSLPDITIATKPFALRYDTGTVSPGYERRRVIIKDNEKLQKGTLDIKDLFDRFKNENWLDYNQHVYHIQFGVEVTDGFGAIQTNHLQMNALFK